MSIAVANQVPLVGSNVLWRVTGGSCDLFAVARGGYGRWFPLGRAATGTIVVPSVPGSGCLLLARPGPGSALDRLDVPGPLAGSTAAGRALAAGIDAGLWLLAAAVATDVEVPAPVPVAPGSRLELAGGGYLRPAVPVVWLEVVSGQAVLHGEPVGTGGVFAATNRDTVAVPAHAVVTGRATADLIADGTLGDRLTAATAGFWRALDRTVADRQACAERQTATRRRASDAALASAVRSLRAQVDAGTARSAAPRPTRPVPERSLRAQVDAGTARSAAPRPTRPVPDRKREPEPLAVVRLAAGHDADVEQVAEAAGFRTRAIRLGDRWWRRDAGPLVGRDVETGAPVALLWQAGGYLAVDPASGRRSPITARSAAALAPTALMLYQPIPDEATSPLQLLRYGLRGARRDAVRMLGGGVVAVALGLLVPIVTGKVLGEYVPDGEPGMLVQACIAVAVAALASVAFAAVGNLSLLRIEGHFEATLQSGLWDRLLRHPTQFFSRYSTGDLASRALSVSAIRETLSGVAAVAVHSLLLGAVNFALQLWISPPLALLSAAMVAVNAAVFATIGARQLRWQRRLVALENALTNQVFQTLQGLPKLRVAGAESHVYAHWAKDFSQSQEMHRQVRRLQGAMTVFNAALVPLCILVLFAVLGGPARHGLSVGGFLTFVVAFAVQLASMSQLTAAITSVVSVLPLFHQFKPILTQPPEVSSASQAPGELTGEIELRGVSFRYSPEGPPVLDDVSLHIGAGSFVAIVGPTGCGKSTLLRLLIGFERPAAGTVRYDGRDLSTLDASAVRRQCGVVLQDARPFNGTILENICGAERFPVEQVREAARMAGLYDDITAMPMGLQTVLTDNGATLSAGQRQRLLIAQALLRRPRVLFLDEATSALDNETQRTVTESTRSLRATRVVIAHRLSTVMQADQIIAMDGGRIVQCGPPQVLLADPAGLFSRLVRRQSGDPAAD
jgi:NHLM bacteriocin system ABC transporter ATP-binding protein